MPGIVPLRELSRGEFRAELDALLAVYAAAMRPDPVQLPGRIAIMERHLSQPGFRAIVASTAPHSPIVAFCYGFRGTPGQWWHDVVRSGIAAVAGQAVATAWLADPLEVAEVHVMPEFQHRGVGRRMLLSLTSGRAERTTILSTQDADSPARRLYRSLGFVDLLTDFEFPGGGPPYAVMGAPLPLRSPGPQSSSGQQRPPGPQPSPGPRSSPG